MSHLSHDELLEAAEGLGAGRAHLQACAACRAEVDALAAVLRQARSVDVPEPSPMFWEHFAGRVRASCRDEVSASEAAAAHAARRDWSLLGAALRPWLARRVVLPALAVLLVAVASARFLRPVSAPGAARSPVVAVAVPAPVPVEATAADEESWQVLSALAAEADPAGSGFETPAPGGADGAVLQMSDDERGELIRLLKAELAQAGSTEG